MNWKEDIKKFNLPHAKIMYMIYYFHKKNDLTDSERLKLKEYVILESNIIFTLFEDFESLENDDDKEDFLISEFKAIYNEEKKYLPKEKTLSHIYSSLKTEKNPFNNNFVSTKDNKDSKKLICKNINIESNNNQLFINVITSSPADGSKRSNEVNII